MKNRTLETVAQLWEKIFDIEKIVNEVANSKTGYITITADAIRQYKEPRLMAKFDTEASLPDVFKNNHLGILPMGRGNYAIGYFDLYEKFPDYTGCPVSHIEFPSFYKTIDIQNIPSEAMALNAMALTSMLNDFLDTPYKEDPFHQTLSGRFGTGKMKFTVHGYNNTATDLSFNGSMIEIDAGFENKSEIVLTEAKNVPNTDFIIRQLYYPYLQWRNAKIINKPIKSVFVVYSNSIYTLMQYEFTNTADYNSINFIQCQRYSFEDVRLSKDIIDSEFAKISQGQILLDSPDTPFPQADNFERIISLLMLLYKGGMDKDEIAAYMDFTTRQSDYYFNALKYLGLACRNDQKCILTEEGKRIAGIKEYKQRMLTIVIVLLKHTAFYDIYAKYLFKKDGYILSFNDILSIVGKFVKNPDTARRRAGTVAQWFKWIDGLLKLRR